ncbi:MAG TPA: PQQ-binding-like beta-propeller repeat protein [Bryobacteraceae bacterium]|nr:PQQ-binding-like beta-propeller repeat protein [Bryobacteraceae bacterium]
MNARWLSQIVAGFAMLSLLAAADWPQWRGPRRDGKSTETGLLKEWPENGPKLLWQIKDIGDGYSTPAVVGSRIYVMSNRGMESEFVQALSVSDGAPVWSAQLGRVGNPKQEPPYPMARSTPTVDGDLLYALSSDGDLACLRTATGKIVWQKSLRSDFGGRPGKWAYSESPLIDGDVLIVTPGGSEATVAALNKKTGALIWKSAVPGGDAAAYSSAVAADAAGRRQYIQFLDKGVVGVDAKTGQFLWRYDKTSTGPANIATPVVDGNYVYSTNARRFGGGLVQLHSTRGGVNAEEVYFERAAPNSLGGQVLLDGYLYGTNPEGPACVEFLTGKIQWKSAGAGPGSVLYVDGRLYIHGENGDMLLLEATPEAYREKGRFTPPHQPQRIRAREMAWAYPVIANGRLYIRDLGTLWCYDVRSKN